MANRKDFYFRQKVTESELDEAFDDFENAEHNIAIDGNMEGIWFGQVVTERGLGQNESVDVSAGSAYDQLGQRMHLPTFQNVDVSVDNVSASTQVAGAGNEKLVGVYLKFDRVLSDPRVDGNSNTVFFERDESFQFVIRQGPEQAAPATTPPALQADEILLCDIRRTFNDNTIATADIETTRRENSWVQVVGETPGVQASEVDLTTTPHTWANATTFVATDAEAGFAEVVSDLSDGTSQAAMGAAKIGLFTSPATWASGDALAAATVGAGMIEIIDDLSSTTATSGAQRVGFEANQSQWADGTNAIAATAVQEAVDEVVTDLAGQTTGDGGKFIGSPALAGVYFSLNVGNVQDQLQQIANEVPAFAADNHFTGDNRFSGANFFTSVASSVPIIEFRQGSGAPANAARRETYFCGPYSLTAPCGAQRVFGASAGDAIATMNDGDLMIIEFVWSCWGQGGAINRSGSKKEYRTFHKTGGAVSAPASTVVYDELAALGIGGTADLDGAPGNAGWDFIIENATFDCVGIAWITVTFLDRP